MCNNVVPWGTRRSKPIPEEGFGWKLFTIFEDKVISLINREVYTADAEGWINWNEKDQNKGFCFFLRKPQALRCRKIWQRPNIVVKKIHYKKGLQIRDEEGMCFGRVYRVSLCQKFKILEQ